MTPKEICKQCGAKCCKRLDFYLQGPITDPCFLNIRGIHGDPETQLYYIEKRCPHLLPNNTCAIYLRRPESCRVYTCTKLAATAPDPAPQTILS